MVNGEAGKGFPPGGRPVNQKRFDRNWSLIQKECPKCGNMQPFGKKCSHCLENGGERPGKVQKQEWEK